ncbi:hypothetical protein [Glaciecola sp. 33A]|jgi:hypothetical protein|uniref:hypothetical protein n=1 Tax=Glaciecola sp. 33A TaxID=2057807 RepID=UPI000C34EE1F|nr:hypothetical protein [Glaciecola sp. 33A]PKI02084.1 hypothetical protein CXF81_08785 [Glaciecola sp. 33A]
MNATLIGQLVLPSFAIVVAVVSFNLGKRKTTSPILVSILGFFLGLVPPLALIYLVVLVLKNDIVEPDNDHSRRNV